MVDYIRELCKSRGISIAKLEAINGLGNGTIAKWDEKEPSIGKVSKIAAYFGITVSELIGENEKAPVQTDERREKEQQIINLYVNLPQDKRAIAMNLLKALAVEGDTDGASDR